MSTSKTQERLNIFLPKDLVKDLRTRIPTRQRTTFITQAISRELQRHRLIEAIETTAGAWSAAEHPELTSPETIAQWVREQRGQSRWPLPSDSSHNA